MAINASKINWTSLETHVIATIASVVTLVTAYSPALGSKATTVASSVDVLIPVVFGLIALGVEIVHAVRKGNVSKVLADVTSAAPQVAAAVTDAKAVAAAVDTATK